MKAYRGIYETQNHGGFQKASRLDGEEKLVAQALGHFSHLGTGAEESLLDSSHVLHLIADSIDRQCHQRDELGPR